MQTSEEPAWLSDEERAAWLALVSVVARLGPALNTQLQRDSGLTFFEYTVLVGLSEAPGRARRMSELADRADGALPRLSQVVARLERRGLVQRHADPEDGRSTIAELTDHGWDLLVASAPAHVAEVRRLVFEPLTAAQTRQLTSIGQRIGQALGPGC